MAITRIKCPGCSTEGTMSFLEDNYLGPYACWKCHQICRLTIKGGDVVSAEVLTPEEQTKARQSRVRNPAF